MNNLNLFSKSNDFSMISSIKSQSSLSMTEHEFDHLNEQTLRQSETDKDKDLIEFVNMEFMQLGFKNIFNPGATQFDTNLLVKNCIDLIRRHKESQSINEHLKEECFKIGRENDLNMKRLQTSRDSHESTKRELDNLEEKQNLLKSKISEQAKTIKELNEENRKLQNLMDQRDKQYKHDRKKLEKEMEKLKEKVKQAINGKLNKDLPNIDMNESIGRSPYGPRATWNTDSSKKQLDLYSELIKDYDFKMKQLIIENTDLKQFISGVYSNLSEKLHNSNGENTQEDEELNDILLRHSFESICSKLNQLFRDKFNLIDELNESVRKGDEKIPNGQNETVSNMLNRTFDCNKSISSICSFDTNEEKNPNVHEIRSSSVEKGSHTNQTRRHRLLSNDASTTNTVVSIDDSKQADFDSATHRYNQSTSSKCDELDNDTSSLQKQLNLLNSELKDCKKAMESQSDFINSLKSLNIFAHVSTPVNNSNKSKATNQIAEVIFEEKQKLASERMHFYQQKVQLEKEESRFRKISTDLVKKQHEFQREQEEFFQSNLYSSFLDNSNESKSNNKTKNNKL